MTTNTNIADITIRNLKATIASNKAVIEAQDERIEALEIKGRNQMVALRHANERALRNARRVNETREGLEAQNRDLGVIIRNLNETITSLEVTARDLETVNDMLRADRQHANDRATMAAVETDQAREAAEVRVKQLVGTIDIIQAVLDSRKD